MITDELNNLLVKFISNDQIIHDNYIIILKIESAIELAKSKKFNDYFFDCIKYIENKLSYRFEAIDLSGSNDIFDSANSPISQDMSINEQIEQMLKNDSNLMASLLEKNNEVTLIDEYGELSQDLLDVTRLLFNKFDVNKDGIITPLDITNIVEIMDLHIFSLCNDMIIEMIKFCASDGAGIDFETFVYQIAFTY